MRVAVRHDAIADTVARLALTVRQFQEQLDILDSEAARLRSSWNGEAQAAYDRAHHDWDTAIRALKAALAEANRRLITANAISRETASTPPASGGNGAGQGPRQRSSATISALNPAEFSTHPA